MSAHYSGPAITNDHAAWPPAGNARTAAKRPDAVVNGYAAPAEICVCPKLDWPRPGNNKVHTSGRRGAPA
jgi:hypothetical protein